MNKHKWKVFRWLFIIALILIRPVMWLRNRLVRGLLSLRTKLHIRSLRTAIRNADKDKTRTGRKNIVVFNRTTAEYEPVQKRVLKLAAESSKNKSNKARTKGRVKMMKARKPRYLSPERVRQIEKKSLYVTG